METRHRHSCHILFAALALLVVLCGPAAAQMAVSPIIIETRVHPGSLRTFELSISNTGAQAIECTTRVSAMAVVAGGMPVEVDEAARSCKDWITVSPERFTLKGSENQRLVCRVRVPKETGGGYYAIISTHGIPQDSSADATGAGVGAGMKFTHRSLVPVMLTVPAPRIGAIIDAGKPIIVAGKGGRGYTFDLPVRNRGNIHARMTGSVEVRSDAGQLISKFDLAAGRGFILPMHERLFRSAMRVSLPDGTYMAKVRLFAKATTPMDTAFPFYVRDGSPTVAELTDEQKAELMKQSSGFTVTPMQMLVSLRPGGRRMQAVELVNLTNQPIEVRASRVEWYRTPDGHDLVSTDSKPRHGRSGLDWITLRSEQIQLRPLSRHRVPVVVALPREATGERYAGVTFDRADVKLDPSAAGRARRSAVMRIWAEGTGTMGADVTEFATTRTPNGALELTMRFANTGEISIKPEISFAIQDVDGRLIGNASPSVDPTAVQAGGEGTVSALWPRVLEPGEYTAILTFRFSPNLPPIVRRAAFVVDAPAAATTQPAATQPATSRPAAAPTTRPVASQPSTEGAPQ